MFSLLVLAFHGLLVSIFAILHADDRFLSVGVRVPQSGMLLLLARDIHVFLPFFLSNAFRVNSMRGVPLPPVQAAVPARARFWSLAAAGATTS